MFSGLANQARLRFRAQTGLSGSVVTLGLITAVSAAAAFCFLCVAAFVWITVHYDALTAGLALGIIFLLVTIVAASLCVYLSKRISETARVEAALASQQNPSAWLDPRLLVIGLQIGRAIGLRRLLPVAAVGLLAALGSREWFAHADRKAQDPQQ
jgi:hypothetical protein